MKYSLISGALYTDDGKAKLAYMKNVFASSEKQVISHDGKEHLSVSIVTGSSCDGVLHEYVIQDMNMNPLAVARPEYSEKEHPDVCKGPINRASLVDHAKLLIKNKEYDLVRKCFQNYEVYEKSGRIAVHISRRGMIGKWTVDADESIEPTLLCGLFVFCKYLEKENELFVI